MLKMKGFKRKMRMSKEAVNRMKFPCEYGIGRKTIKKIEIESGRSDEEKGE